MIKRLTAVAVAASILLTSCSVMGAGGGGTYKVTALFPRAVSLYKLSAVRVLGLPAGRVTNIQIDGTQVKVSMEIKKTIPLPEGVNATIVPQSLIGERYVQLFPAWTEGQQKVASGELIPLGRTSIPVEPDEALAALKKFLDTLDPNATGRLVTNLADDLRGNGQHLNDAIRGLAQLSTTVADKDQQLVDIIDHFDKFSATLRTREVQLGKVMDQFAVATKLLADERDDVAGLVKNLGTVSKDGLDLVSVHGARLDHDLSVLTQALLAINTNMDSVRQLLSSGPVLVAGDDLTGKHGGLAAAYDPKYHHLDLRNAVSPTAAQLFGALGLPQVICLPVDVNCTPTPAGGTPVPVPVPLPASPASATPAVTTPPVSTPGAPAAGAGTTVPSPAPTTPSTLLPPVSVPDAVSRLSVDSPSATILRLMATPATAPLPPARLRTGGGATARHAGGATGWLRRAARSLVRAL
ncbi:MAG: phospholipid/cholesterol/gamma-HCH transport system substrate-binding protein [Acidimicrobiaceae bacterium]|nr:phospholipid/cholesterol/gamma-HCH transport system substrate-binding protein [Acidimicrobiaceae bacterium]